MSRTTSNQYTATATHVHRIVGVFDAFFWFGVRVEERAGECIAPSCFAPSSTPPPEEVEPKRSNLINPNTDRSQSNWYSYYYIMKLIKLMRKITEIRTDCILKTSWGNTLKKKTRVEFTTVRRHRKKGEPSTGPTFPDELMWIKAHETWFNEHLTNKNTSEVKYYYFSNKKCKKS